MAIKTGLKKAILCGTIFGQFLWGNQALLAKQPDHDSYKDYQVTSSDSIIQFVGLAKKINAIQEYGTAADKEKLSLYEGERNSILKDVETKLEGIVEADIYAKTSIDVNINSELTVTGVRSLLILSRKDKLGIEEFVYYDQILNEEEGYAAEYLAELVGPIYTSRIDANSAEFKTFASLLQEYKECIETEDAYNYTAPPNNVNHTCKEIESRIQQLQDTILKKSNIPADIEKENNKEEYSARTFIAAGENNGKKTTIDASIDDLYILIMVYGHESGHHIVRKNESVKDALQSSYDGEGYEESVIEETACDIFGDMIAKYFSDHHLKNDFSLMLHFMNSGSNIQERYKKRREKLKDIIQLYEEGKKEEIKTGLEEKKLNAATLALENLYSGNKKVFDNLSYLQRELEAKTFIELIDNLDTYQELEKAVALVKSGIKDQKTLEGKIGIYK